MELDFITLSRPHTIKVSTRRMEDSYMHLLRKQSVNRSEGREILKAQYMEYIFYRDINISTIPNSKRLAMRRRLQSPISYR